MWWQVKAQVQQFRDQEARLAEAEQLASTHAGREAALAARQQSMSDVEDKAQRANAAAEYAQKEAEAMWQKQKVRHLGCINLGLHALNSGCVKSYIVECC